MLQGWSQDEVETIKNTVAKGATDPELKMFLSLAHKYDLDPFAKEIWCIKNGNNIMIQVGRDGFLKIAQSDKRFKGIQSMTVYTNDELEIDPVKGAITHKPNLKDRGTLLGAWCRVEKEGITPFITYVELKEYRKTSPIWNTMPGVMIQKVAQTVALRMTFGINGLYSPDEIDNTPTQSTPHKNIVEVKEEKVEPVVLMNEKQMKKLYEIWKEIAELKEMDEERSKKVWDFNLSKFYGVESLNKLTEDQAGEYIIRMKELLKRTKKEAKEEEKEKAKVNEMSEKPEEKEKEEVKDVADFFEGEVL